MKYKKWIIISVLLVVIGLMTAVITLASNQFNVGSLDKSVVSKTYEINEEFDSIKCMLDEADLNIYYTTEEKNYAICLENDKITFSVNVVNNVLTIKEETKFHFMLFKNPEISIFVNKKTLESLDVDTSTGEISIIEQLKINKINIEASTADIDLMNIESDNIVLDVTTGDVDLTNIKTKEINVTTSTGDIDFEKGLIMSNATFSVSTGDIELSNVEISGELITKASTGELDIKHLTCTDINLKLGTGEISLEDVIASNNMTINASTGSVELEHCDALNINIETTTGSVVGSILSSKIFDAKSSTSKVVVPETYSGGICKIRTSTGRIYIVIE